MPDASRREKYFAAERDGASDAAVYGAHEPQPDGSAAGERRVAKVADGGAARGVADFRSCDVVRAAVDHAARVGALKAAPQVVSHAQRFSRERGSCARANSHFPKVCIPSAWCVRYLIDLWRG